MFLRQNGQVDNLLELKVFQMSSWHRVNMRGSITRQIVAAGILLSFLGLVLAPADGGSFPGNSATGKEEARTVGGIGTARKVRKVGLERGRRAGGRWWWA